jgi:hypothetical protein
MPELLGAVAVLLAWFVFRYERDRRTLDAIDSAHATLRAVQYAMVESRGSGQQGWGHAYFWLADYDRDKANERAAGALNAVYNHHFEQIFVVPTEPLVKLATAEPHDGLIEYKTVASAGFALWHLHVFNQHVRQLTDFNTRHVVEISSTATEPARREELGAGAEALSFMLHRYGIGWAWSEYPNGAEGRGWYGEFVEALEKNVHELQERRRRHLARWLESLPYVVADLVAVGLLVAAVVHAVQ